MTEARVTQSPVEVATTSDAPRTRVSQADVQIGLAGSPALIASGVSTEVATTSDAPRARISGVAVQVLVGWRVKQRFQAIWIE